MPSKVTSVTAQAIKCEKTAYTRGTIAMHADTVMDRRVGHKDIVVTAGRSIGRIATMAGERHRIPGITAVPGIIAVTSQSIA